MNPDGMTVSKQTDIRWCINSKHYTLEEEEEEKKKPLLFK